jgi:hypothetical protein
VGGNNGIGVPAQKGVIGVKVGVAFEKTVITFDVVGDETQVPELAVKL